MHTVVLRVSNACNLRCRYCYDAGNHCGKIKDMREQVTEEFQKNQEMLLWDLMEVLKGSRRKTVLFHGGEPLLVEAAVLHEFCERLTAQMGEVRFGIQTNATLIEEQTLSFFKKHRVQVGISLDGANEEQNKERVFPNGSNTFPVLMKKIEWLKREQIRFGVVMSIHKGHIGQEAVLYEFLAKNQLMCNIRPVFASHNASKEQQQMVMTPDEYSTFFNRLFDIWFYDTEKRVTTWQIQEFAKEVSRVTIEGYHEPSCGCSKDCFRNFISLDVYGNAYACNRLYGIESFYYGNLRTEGKEKIEQNADKLVQKRQAAVEVACKECEWFSSCYGGCPAEGYDTFGTIEGISADCQIKKAIRSHVRNRIETCQGRIETCQSRVERK